MQQETATKEAADETPAKEAAEQPPTKEILQNPARAPASYGPSAAEWLDCASALLASILQGANLLV